jgi:proline dehydrogenase
MYTGPKSVFHWLSQSIRLKRLASRYGMARENSFARRFIAGETLEEALGAARALQNAGFLLTLDYLGESVRSFDEATNAAREYVKMLDAVVVSGIERNISLKLTQLGAGIDLATCVDNLRRIVDAAQQVDCFVRIDMENSPYTERTLEAFEILWQRHYRNLGVALQAALHRTEKDIQRMNELGARVRLVKGAYKEPPSVAYQKKAEVDDAFKRHTRTLLDAGTYPAIATHDPAMLNAACDYAAKQGIEFDRFEFQMLYGVRRDLQKKLVAQGHRVRVYVPFGKEWFPYFMRRLGERPANVWFVVRAILSEQPED